MSEIQIDFLTRKLVDADSYPDEKPSRSAVLGDGAKCLRESEAILVIKQLQEKVCCFQFMLLFLFFLIVNLGVICLALCHFSLMSVP